VSYDTEERQEVITKILKDAYSKIHADYRIIALELKKFTANPQNCVANQSFAKKYNTMVNSNRNAWVLLGISLIGKR